MINCGLFLYDLSDRGISFKAHSFSESVSDGYQMAIKEFSKPTSKSLDMGCFNL